MAEDWKMGGATGTTAPDWVAFSDAALRLLDGGETPYALITQVVQATEEWERIEFAANAKP